MVKISPSIMAADFSNLQQQILLLEEAGADMLHLDIMDGNYVPNITFGLDIVETIRDLTKLPLDAHLMVKQPEQWLEAFASRDVDYISFHQDAMNDASEAALTELLQKYHNIKLGLALNPGQQLPNIDLSLVSIVLIMCVWPGKCGQQFISSSLDTIRDLKALFANLPAKRPLISVDGGINAETGKQCKKAGADILVSGSYVFNGNFGQRISLLKG